MSILGGVPRTKDWIGSSSSTYLSDTVDVVEGALTFFAKEVSLNLVLGEGLLA